MSGRKSITIPVNQNTNEAILYLKDHLVGGFNLSKFVRQAIEGHAGGHGWLKKISEDGTPTDWKEIAAKREQEGFEKFGVGKDTFENIVGDDSSDSDDDEI